MTGDKTEEEPGSSEKYLKEQKGQRDCDGCGEKSKIYRERISGVATIREDLRMSG